MLFVNQFELIIPTPATIAGSTRIALFADVGNVFSTGGVTFQDRLGDPIDQSVAELVQPTQRMIPELPTNPSNLSTYDQILSPEGYHVSA